MATMSVEKIGNSSTNMVDIKSVHFQDKKNKTIEIVSETNELPEDELVLQSNKIDDNFTQIRDINKASATDEMSTVKNCTEISTEVNNENYKQKSKPTKASRGDKVKEVGLAIQSIIGTAIAGVKFGAWGVAAGVGIGLLINAPTVIKCGKWAWNKIKS